MFKSIKTICEGFPKNCHFPQICAGVSQSESVWRGHFFSPQRPDHLWGPPSLLPMGTGGPFPGGEARPGRDTDHSLPNSAEVKNEYELSPQASLWRAAVQLKLSSGTYTPLPGTSEVSWHSKSRVLTNHLVTGYCLGHTTKLWTLR
jgi:hypothetical protein